MDKVVMSLYSRYDSIPSTYCFYVFAGVYRDFAAFRNRDYLALVRPRIEIAVIGFDDSVFKEP
jgi:hypothetical protein